MGIIQSTIFIQKKRWWQCSIFVGNFTIMIHTPSFPFMVRSYDVCFTVHIQYSPRFQLNFVQLDALYLNAPSYQTTEKKRSHKRERNQSGKSNKVEMKQSANTSWLLSKQQHKLISFPFYQPHNACIFDTINNTKFVCVCVCVCVNNVQVCFATGSCFLFVL